MRKFAILLSICILILIPFMYSCQTDIPEGKIPEVILQEIEESGRLTPYSEEWAEDLSFYVKLHTVYGIGDAATGVTRCTGNVIYADTEETVILTAGHCIGPNYPYSPVNILIERSDGKLFSTTEYYINQKYAYGDRTADIAVIILKEDMGVKPIPVKISTLPEVGDIAYLGGFGYSEDSPNGYFTSGEVIVIGSSDSYVNIRYTGRKQDHYACFGSSGGGLLGETLNTDRTSRSRGLIGIASTISSRTCHEHGNEGHFVRLDQHIGFLLKHVPNLTIN